MAVSIKETRIEFRVPKETKKILEDAANLANISLSSYIVSICLKQAKIDLEQNEIITLSNAQRDEFLKALEEPFTPNDSLRGLFK